MGPENQKVQIDNGSKTLNTQDQAQINVSKEAQKFGLVSDKDCPGLYYLIDSTGLVNNSKLSIEDILKQGKNIGSFAGLSSITGLHKAHLFPVKILDTLGVARKQASASLLHKALNLYEKQTTGQDKIRDFRVSGRLLESPLEILLNKSLTTKYDMMDNLIRDNKNQCPVLQFQVASARCMPGPAVDQLLYRSRALGLHYDDF